MQQAAAQASGDGRDTRARLLRAAGELFATRGFHGTTIREIAARARVNVAAGHYHCGSKKDLYLAVLREQFAEVWARLNTGGARTTAAALDGLPRRELERLLRARIRVLLGVLVGPSPTIHSTLVLREMLDPGEALPVIVEEFVRPMLAETSALVHRLEPTLSPEATRRCVMSIVGQMLFHRSCMPAVLRVLDIPAFSETVLDGLADHIAAFSTGGITARARGQRQKAHARR
jgi:AcrR family transcriptional regulator